MLLCLNNSSCMSSGRCISGICVCTNSEVRYNALTLPIVGAIRHDIPSLRYIYLFIFIFLASIGLISNSFSLITFIRDRIRFTICGIYLIIFSICGIILMMLFLTNIIVTLRYDDYLFRL
jgi:ABC-type transport system involved in multi-copper enzyme maturation permease subunit